MNTAEAPRFIQPAHGVSVGRGKIFVADHGNSRIQVFDLKGSFIDECKGPQLGRPFGVATHEGEVFVIDDGDQPSDTRSRVVVCDESGALIHTFDASLPSDERNLGHDIAVDSEGAVYVADTWANSIRKFNRNDWQGPKSRLACL